MNYLAPLFTLQRRIFRNTYWRTRRQRITTTLLISAVVGATVGAAYLFNRYLLLQFLDPAWLLDPAFGWFAFGLVVIFIFFAALTQSMANLIPRFYRSPDLNYLLALPIPANRVLAIKFLAAQLQSSLGVLFLSFAVLIATGWSIGAPWYYYAALLPVFWVFTLIPAGIGLLIGMVLLRLMTAKTFSRLAGVLSFGTIIVWFALAGIPMEQLIPLLARAMELFGRLPHILVDLIPLVSAGSLLNAFAVAEPVQGIRPLLMLLMVTGVAMILIFWLARHLFLQGWLVTQSAPAAPIRKARAAAARREAKVHPPWIAAVLTEWRRALRNEEMRLTFFGMLAGYVAAVVFLIDGRLLDWLGGSPAAGLVVLVLYAAVLLPMGVVILFLPAAQLAQAGSSKAMDQLLRRSMWLTKALPLTTTEVVLIAVVKIMVVPFLLGAVGILIYALVAEVALVHALLAVIGLLLLLLGSSVGSTGQEFWGYARAGKINPLIANLLDTLVPIAYFIAAAGPLTLYLLGGIPWLAFFRIQPLLIGGLISWPAVSLLAIWGGWKLATRSWEAMEIE
ncbi:MAG: hypothetical protein DDT28_00305 [Dehalococcoidia bacterium]|nr:hypothetical protein [Chloroflexota bacterium]